MDRLFRYEALLRDWQTRMNLVGPATLDQIWSRHFHDSAQLTAHVPAGRRWLDIGAGGGFPGLVLACMDHGDFVLVDSVAKKCAFLQAVIDELGLSARVLCARVETLPTIGVDVVTARAAAPLDRLLGWAIRHVKPGGQMLFPKGRNWAKEVEIATKRFAFQLDLRDSETDPDARILILRDVERRHG